VDAVNYIQWVGAMDAAKQTTKHSLAPPKKNYLVGIAKVEKTGLKFVEAQI
jgi:hypothetical protein